VDSLVSGGSLYYYQVTAVATGGESDRSVFVSGRSLVDTSPPAAPGDLSAVADASSARITLTWSPPAADSNGGDLTGVVSYIVSRSKGSSTSFVAVDTVAASQTRFVDSGLDAASLYYYAVRAVDAAGNLSARSSSVSATTAGVAAPTDVAATAGVRRITVTWDASTADALRGYNVYRSTRSDGGFTRLTGIEGSTFTTGKTAYIDSGMVGGTTYYYRVTVVTSTQESPQSAFSGATARIDDQAPGVPSFVEGEPVVGNPEHLSLTWKPPTTDLSGGDLTGISRYLVFRASSTQGPFTEIGSTTTAAYLDTGLTAHTTYYYRVQALDDDGNAGTLSSTTALTTGGVDMPKNVRLSASTPSSSTSPPVVTVQWDGAAGAILYYEVQRTTVANSTSDADYTSVTPNTLSTSRTDNGVTRGVTYYYRVRSRDIDQRASDWTDPLSVEVKN
jgi:fibronectin type 3 domain-containing protein